MFVLVDVLCPIQQYFRKVRIFTGLIPSTTEPVPIKANKIDTGSRRAVRSESDYRSRGRQFHHSDPGVASSVPARTHALVEIDYEIISMVILHFLLTYMKGRCQYVHIWY